MVAICALVLCVVLGPQLAAVVHGRATPEKEQQVLLQMPLAQELADVLSQLIPKNGGVEDCATEACKTCYANCRIWCRFVPSCYPDCAEQFECDSNQRSSENSLMTISITDDDPLICDKALCRCPHHKPGQAKSPPPPPPPSTGFYDGVGYYGDAGLTAGSKESVCAGSYNDRTVRSADRTVQFVWLHTGQRGSSAKKVSILEREIDRMVRSAVRIVRTIECLDFSSDNLIGCSTSVPNVMFGDDVSLDLACSTSMTRIDDNVPYDLASDSPVKEFFAFHANDNEDLLDSLICFRVKKIPTLLPSSKLFYVTLDLLMEKSLSVKDMIWLLFEDEKITASWTG
ncbi:hypothetical protein PR202_gb17002 [Eleusine coracana subsp. coracana]|uniref:VDE lipocalin domain-containing protein n=1 Tax=Eleusine coracana subsp. coracana TaxID=191504 RepID=A0AAV5F1U1_ELECO|nr:hypothetical protein PR202_gb17002 [Eleusine coracana subsp. coracana]